MPLRWDLLYQAMTEIISYNCEPFLTPVVLFNATNCTHVVKSEVQRLPKSLVNVLFDPNSELDYQRNLQLYNTEAFYLQHNLW